MQTTRHTNVAGTDPAATVSFAAAGSKESTVGGRSDTADQSPASPSTGEPAQAGRFTLIRRLGEGGFGTVYLAHDPVLDRDVALKLPRAGGASTQHEARRILDEARTAARLKHPHVVTIYEVGECGEQGGFIAMEYVDGESLAERLKRGPLTVAETVRVCGQIAEAIQHAHKLGMVHRDLKTANVMLDRNGDVKVCDFGLTMTDDAPHARRGEVSGTWPYMSPEQIRGDIHLLDGRSDLWSLGVILYECLSGRRPFRGNNLAEIHEDIQTRDPKPLRQFDDAIPPALDDLFRHCTQRDVARRLPTAGDFNRALDRTTRRPRRAPRQAAWLAAAAVAILLCGLLGLAVWSQRPPGSATPTFAVGQAAVIDRLAQAPRPVVFSPSDIRSHYAYAAETRRLIVDTDQWSLFSCGPFAGTAMFDVALVQDGTTGLAGFFWGLGPKSAASGAIEHHCLAIAVEHDLSGAAQDLVRLHRLVLLPDQSGGLHVQSSDALGDARTTIDWNVPVELRFRISDGGMSELTVQGARIELALEPVVRGANEFATGECGFLTMGHGATFLRTFEQLLNEEP